MAKQKEELTREQRIVRNAIKEREDYAESLGIELDDDGVVIEPEIEVIVDKTSGDSLGADDSENGDSGDGDSEKDKV